MCYLSDDQSNWNELLWISHVKLSQLSRHGVSPFFLWRNGADHFLHPCPLLFSQFSHKESELWQTLKKKKKKDPPKNPKPSQPIAVQKVWPMITGKKGSPFLSQYNAYNAQLICSSVPTRSKKWNASHGVLKTFRAHCQWNIVVVDSNSILPNMNKWTNSFMWVQRKMSTIFMQFPSFSMLWPN